MLIEEIGKIIEEVRATRKLTLAAFSEGAGVSTKSVTSIVSGEFFTELPGATRRRRIGIGGSLARVARFCGQNPEVWLKAADLEDVMSDALADTNRAVNMQLEVTLEDIKFLEDVLAGVPSLSLELVVSLLERRAISR